jgi:hypothetical protein
MSGNLPGEAEEHHEKPLSEPRSDILNHIVLSFKLKIILNKYSSPSLK